MSMVIIGKNIVSFARYLVMKERLEKADNSKQVMEVKNEVDKTD